MKFITLGTLFLVICGLIIRWISLPEIIKDKIFINNFGRRYTEEPYSFALNDLSAQQITKTRVYSSLFSIDRILEKNETEKLISVLLDSSNYTWEGRSALRLERIFIFYNNENQIIGTTEYNLSGQTESIPSNEEIMKWGKLKVEACRKVEEIIK